MTILVKVGWRVLNIQDLYLAVWRTFHHQKGPQRLTKISLSNHPLFKDHVLFFKYVNLFQNIFMTNWVYDPQDQFCTRICWIGVQTWNDLTLEEIYCDAGYMFTDLAWTFEFSCWITILIILVQLYQILPWARFLNSMRQEKSRHSAACP